MCDFNRRIEGLSRFTAGRVRAIFLPVMLLMILIFFNFRGHADTLPRVIDLRCEYLVNPIGIDIPQPRFSWQMEDTRRGAGQSAWQIMVSTDSLALLSEKAEMWNSGKVDSDRTNAIRYQGLPLESRTRYFWRLKVWDKNGMLIREPQIASWETGVFHLREWQGDWIDDGKEPDFLPAPFFRKQFQASGGIKSARAYITGLGYYELYLNGNKVGDQLLAPAYTRFDKTTMYQVYDVTDLLEDDTENAAGIILGNGWFNIQSKAVWDFHDAPWRARPRLLLNLMIDYEDGSRQWVVSDTTWKVTHGPILFNSLYSGEYYDARLDMPEWNRPGYDDAGWNRANASLPNAGKLTAQVMPPIRMQQEIQALSVKKVDSLTWLFDFGQNFSGTSRIRVSGQAGTELRMTHGEVVNENGRLDIQRISVHFRFEFPEEKAQTNRFTLSGKGEETFMPRFTYHGFRYVEVTSNKPVELDHNSLTGLVFYTDLKRTGKFNASNDLLNRINTAGIWSYVSNLHGIPTDCPHREKNGWTGDGHAVTELAIYNYYDAILFYEKWLRDHIDEQRPSGEIPGIIPSSGWGYHFGNGPAWDAGLLLIPWYIYLYYGDNTLIMQYYENLKRYVDYLSFRSKNHLQYIGLGDWSPYRTRTPAEFTSSLYYFVLTGLLAEFAGMHGLNDDADYYSGLSEEILTAIQREFYDEKNALYSIGSQTALSAALYQGVVPKEKKAAVAANLKKRIEADDNHLDVGFLGSKYLLNALTDNGLNDVAYHLATRETRPSWGWWLAQGETTFQEGWSLGPSRNHIFLGEILAWFYRALGGIAPDRENPGYKNIIIKPHFPAGLEKVEASIMTPHGMVSSMWNNSRRRIDLDFTVPPNTTAWVYLPASNPDQIRENGKRIDESLEEIRFLKQENDRLVYEVVSGKYIFEIRK